MKGARGGESGNNREKYKVFLRKLLADGIATEESLCSVAVRQFDEYSFKLFGSSSTKRERRLM